MTTKKTLTGNGINTRNAFRQKTIEEVLEEIRKAASKPKPKPKPKPLFVGYAQIGGETLKKVIYE